MERFNDALARARVKHVPHADDAAPIDAGDPAVLPEPVPNGQYHSAPERTESTQAHETPDLPPPMPATRPRRAGARYIAVQRRRYAWLQRHAGELRGRDKDVALYLVAHHGTGRGYGLPLERIGQALDMHRPHVYRSMARLCDIGFLVKRPTRVKRPSYYRFKIS